jgi:hypothetical protein
MRRAGGSKASETTGAGLKPPRSEVVAIVLEVLSF